MFGQEYVCEKEKGVCVTSFARFSNPPVSDGNTHHDPQGGYTPSWRPPAAVFNLPEVDGGSQDPERECNKDFVYDYTEEMSAWREGMASKKRRSTMGSGYILQFRGSASEGFGSDVNESLARRMFCRARAPGRRERLT